jgi:uncharacterized membrane protein
MTARRHAFIRSLPEVHFAVLVSFMVLSGGGGLTCAAGMDGGGASARAAAFELDIAPENATKQIDMTSPVKSASFRFQVRNTGDSSLPLCDLMLTPWDFPQESWTYNFVPSLPAQIESGETKSFFLVIYPHSDAGAKLYTFKLQGKGMAPVSNSITVYLDILQYGDVEVRAPPPQDADPGDTLEYVFELANTGNGNDEFVITSVECSIVAISPYLRDGNNRTGAVGYGQSVNKTVVVVIPQGMATTEGTAGFQLALSARSGFNSSQDDTNWTLIRVNHTYNLDLVVSPLWATLVPGRPAGFNITVVNGGNGNDRISLNVTPRFDALSWTVVLGQGSFSLAAGGNGTTVLEIIAPEEVLPGSYCLNISALSSGPPSGPPGRLQILECQIPLVRGLWAPELDFQSPYPIYPGELIQFAFNFTNVGNTDEFINVTWVEKPLNWSGFVQGFESPWLAPQETRWVNLTLIPPLDRSDLPVGDYHVKLRVANADLTAVLDFTFGMTRKPISEWNLLGGSHDDVIYPGVQPLRNFTFSLVNTGEAVENISLAVDGDNAEWGSLEVDRVSLGPDESKSLNLTVRVPAASEGGRRCALNVTATSDDGAGISRTAGFSFRLVVVDLRPVPGSLSFSPPNPEAGSQVRIRVELENLGSDIARYVNVGFLGPDMEQIGLRNISTISRVDGRVTAEILWIGVPEGQNNISVIVDPDGIIPEPDKANNRISAVVTGYLSDLVIDGAPVIQRAGKNVTRVPLGSGVEVTVTVRNIGNYSLDLQSVKVVLSDRQTGEQDIFVINRLPAGGSVNVTFKLAKPKVGTRVITVRVNPDGAVHEKTPDNNEKSGTFYVYEGGPGPTGLPIILVAAVIVLVLLALVAAVVLRHPTR